MASVTDALVHSLANFLQALPSVAILGGAGVSTSSGIPDYRDRNGTWKHSEPIQFGEFVRSASARQRYWARSYLGWQRFGKAEPNAAHVALAKLEASGRIDTLITQNVDGLHSAAGSRRVIDLHGKLALVRCLECDVPEQRAAFQQRLVGDNPGWHAKVFRYKPDGDADIAETSHLQFTVPGCTHCGGMLKPDVVMFGESVPRERVENAMAAIERADGLLVVGTSLMVFSGFRFVRRANALGKPIAIVNHGHTRADDLASAKFDADVTMLLPAAVEALGSRSGSGPVASAANARPATG